MSAVDTFWASLLVPVVQDVCPCCGHGAERVWPCHLPWQAASPAQDLEAEPSAIELIYANSMREEIAEIYCDVTSCDGCQGKFLVMQRWRSISARKSWIPSRNTSGISGTPYHQRRNQVDAPPAPPGMTPRPTIAPRAVLTTTSSKI